MSAYILYVYPSCIHIYPLCILYVCVYIYPVYIILSISILYLIIITEKNDLGHPMLKAAQII